MALRITVDRIEEGYAVCEYDGGILKLPVCAFDGEASEGGVYMLGLTRDVTEECMRAERITGLFEKLKSKGENKQ